MDFFVREYVGPSYRAGDHCLCWDLLFPHIRLDFIHTQAVYLKGDMLVILDNYSR